MSAMSSPEQGSPSLRREVEIKRELRMEQEAARSTFQPMLSTRRVSNASTKPAAGSRFDSLYNDAIKRKTQGIKVVVDESNNTFKPTISPKSRSVSRERGTTELYDSLHRASGAGRAAIKEAPIEANLFKPTISKRARSLERSSSVSDMNSRLSESLRKSKTNMERDKDEAAKRDAEICTFSPKLYRSRSASRSRDEDTRNDSVTERLLKYGEKMKIRLQEEQFLRLKEDLTNVTFKPNVNRSRSSTPQRNGSDGDVYSRLNQRLEKDTSVMIAERDIELTFQPKISRSNVPTSHDGDNVHERLFKEAVSKKMESEKEIRLSQEEEALKCTFAPQITHLKPSDNASVDTSTATPVFERLHDSRHFMQKILSQIKDDLEMSECTFQPSLAPKAFKSERRPSEGSVHVRLDKDAQLKKLEALKREEEKIASELQGSTFRPHVPESSQGIVRRKSCIDGDDAAAIHDRLNSTHTVSSLGGYISTTSQSDLSPSRIFFDKATVDAVVERLLAAGGKQKEDLRASQDERELEVMKGSTFSPSINENSVKIATRHKEKGTLRALEEGEEESPMDSSTLSISSSASRIQARSTSAQRRSTFSGRAADSGIYRRASECDMPIIGYVAKIFSSEKSVKSGTHLSSEKSGKHSFSSESSAPPVISSVTPKKVSSINGSAAPSAERKAPSAEIARTSGLAKKALPVSKGRNASATAKQLLTVNVERSPVSGKKAPSPVTGKKEASPVTGKKEASPVTGKKEASPVTGKKEASPVTGKKEASPVTGKKEASPVTGKKEASPVTGKKEASPATGKKVPAPMTGKKVPSSIPAEKASSPVTGKKEASPTPAAEAPSPIHGEKDPSLVPAEEAYSLVSDKKASSPVADKRSPSPIPGEKLSSPVTDKRSTSPIPGEKASSPVTDKRSSSPIPGEKASSPATDNKASSPVADKRSPSPIPGEKASSPVTVKKASSPIPGEKASTPVADKRSPSPIPGEKLSSPVNDKKASSPVTDKRSPSPIPGENASSPVADKKASSIPAEKASSPVTDKKASSPIPGEKASSPVADKRSPSPIPGEKLSSPVADKKASSSVPGEKAHSPIPGDRASSLVTQKEMFPPVTEKEMFSLDLCKSPIDNKRSPSTERSRIPLPVKRSPSIRNVKTPTPSLDNSEDAGGLRSSSLTVDTAV